MANFDCDKYIYINNYNMSDEIEPHILKRYEVVRKIGKGAYGVVIELIYMQRYGKLMTKDVKIHVLY